MTYNPSPVLVNPITDFSAQFDSMGNRPMCRALAIQYARCRDAYGWPHSVKKCRDEFEDVRECAFSELQSARSKAIRKRREELYNEKKLDQMYICPPADAIYQDYQFEY